MTRSYSFPSLLPPFTPITRTPYELFLELPPFSFPARIWPSHSLYHTYTRVVLSIFVAIVCRVGSQIVPQLLRYSSRILRVSCRLDIRYLEYPINSSSCIFNKVIGISVINPTSNLCTVPVSLSCINCNLDESQSKHFRTSHSFTLFVEHSDLCYRCYVCEIHAFLLFCFVFLVPSTLSTCYTRHHCQKCMLKLTSSVQQLRNRLQF